MSQSLHIERPAATPSFVPGDIRYPTTGGRTNRTRRTCVIPLKLWIQPLGWGTRSAAGSWRDEGEGSDINLDEVTLPSGCNLPFVAVVMAIADPGDEFILPVPWYALAYSCQTLIIGSSVLVAGILIISKLPAYLRPNVS